MKKYKRLLALVLVLAMAVCVVCIPASAEETAAPNEYGITNYFALGDSIGDGMNAENSAIKKYFTVDENGNKTEVNSTDEYTLCERYYGTTEVGYINLIAKKLGLLDINTKRPDENAGLYTDTSELYYGYDNGGNTNYNSWAHCAFRTVEMRMLLDENYSYSDGYLELMEQCDADHEHAATAACVADLEKADLITLNVGSNEIFVVPLTYAIVKLYSGSTDTYVIQTLKNLQTWLQEQDNETTMLDTVISTMETLNLVDEFITVFAEYSAYGYAMYMTNLVPLLTKIREINPTAEMRVIGVYNPFYYTSLSGNTDAVITIGKLLGAVIAPINTYTAMYAPIFNYKTVNVAATKIDSSGHPSNEGYEYMAEQVMASLTPVNS